MNDTTTGGVIALHDGELAAEANGQRARFTAQEFRVLKALATKPGVTVSKPELELALYGAAEKAAESNVVEVLVMRLRKRLQIIGVDRVITTRRGLGYSFVGKVV